jgi:capsular polysaccharide transport system permease protein
LPEIGPEIYYSTRVHFDLGEFSGMKQKTGLSTFASAVWQKKNVMTAVMLRDMRSRFFNHGLGFLVQSLWPLTHMVVLLILYGLAGRETPFGSSLNIFFATGLVPTLTFMYVSRFMSLSILINRSMMSFAWVITLSLIILFLLFVGDDPMPANLSEAVLCYLTTILLAVGVGTLAGVIVMFFEMFVTVYALLCIVFYISSGTLFVANQFPDSISIPLSYNPIVQCVEWMRTAYFENYSDRLVSKEYVVMFGIVCLLIGLLLERTFRMRIKDG